MKKVILLSILLIITAYAYAFPPSSSFTDAWASAQKGATAVERVFYWEEAKRLYTDGYKYSYLETVCKMLAYGYYELALPYYEQYKSNPEDASAYQTALEYFKQSAEQNSIYFYPENWLYSTFEAAEDFDSAVNYYSQRIQDFPDRPHSYFFRAKAVLASSLEGPDINSNVKKDLEEAAALFNKLIDSGVLSDDLVGSSRDNIEECLQTLCRISLDAFAINEFHRKCAMLADAVPDFSDYDTAFLVFQSIMFRQLDAYAAGRYGEALDLHERAAVILSGNSRLEKEVQKNNYFEDRKDLIRARRELGTDVKPEEIYIIFVLSLGPTDILEMDIHQTGRILAAREEITAEMLRLAEVRQEVFKKDIEAMSRGRVSLRFVEAEDSFPITSLEHWYFNGRHMISPDISEARRGGGPEFWYQTCKNNDTVLQYWHSGTIQPVSSGSTFSSPYELGTLRGSLTIPINKMLSDWHNTLIMHEFFHLVEFRFAISPVHGYLCTAEETGMDYIPVPETDQVSREIEYYWAHFSRITEGDKWGELSFINNYPLPVYSEHLRKLNEKPDMAYTLGITEKEYENALISVRNRIPKTVPVRTIDTENDEFSFLFFSDPHVTDENHRVLASLPSKLQESDLFIISGGDNVVDGREITQFEAFKNLIYRTGLPWFSAPGNHDVIGGQGFKNFTDQIGPTMELIIVGDVSILIIDTASGIVSDEQIDIIETILESHPGAVIVSHLNFFSDIQAGKPQMIVDEKIRLMEIFERSNVPLVLTGHTHGQYRVVVNGIQYEGVPDFYSSRAAFLRIRKNRGDQGTYSIQIHK